MSSNSDTTHVFHCTVLESEDVFPCGKEKQKGKGKEEEGKRKQKGKKKKEEGKSKKKRKKDNDGERRRTGKLILDLTVELERAFY